MDTFSLRCLQCGTIKLMLFTVWAHEASVSYNMDKSYLRCLQHGAIKLTLFTPWIHQNTLLTVWTQ
jgi:uncharacterized protein YdaU (DUF1376 family)